MKTSIKYLRKIIEDLGRDINIIKETEKSLIVKTVGFWSNIIIDELQYPLV